MKRYGRLCPVVVFSAVGGFGDAHDYGLGPSEVTITANGQPVPFEASTGTEAIGDRPLGCHPHAPTRRISVSYTRYVLTPRAPLPPASMILVSGHNADRRVSVTTGFETTTNLDKENCETLPAPGPAGPCAPPVQECHSADGGASPDAWLALDTRLSVPRPPDTVATDAATTDVAAFRPAGAVSGCSVTGGASPLSAFLLLAVAGLCRRAGRRPR